MKNLREIKICIMTIQVLLSIVSIMFITVFAMKPTDSVMLSNGLITIVILTQLFMINMMIAMYEKIGGKKK